jgi:hypothetical protein
VPNDFSFRCAVPGIYRRAIELIVNSIVLPAHRPAMSAEEPQKEHEALA